MKVPYKINAWYSVLLILLGIFGLLARYIDVGDWQFTAIIPSAFGIILLFCTTGIKKENAIIGHVAALLTTLLILMSVVMLTRGILAETEWERKQWIFLIVILGGIFSLRSQIQYFIAQRKRKALNNS
ncbi:MAG: hypothetical protein ACEPOZ_15820 [Marinifilaceae bacterium]